MENEPTEQGLEPRIIVYCVDSFAYKLLRAWAERRRYRLALVVTSPGPARARSTGYWEIIAQAPPEQDILVTTGMRRIVPVIAALAPDLIISFTLPFRLPPEIIELPRHGAVNLHPSPLPAYRGPNPARMIYEGEPILGASLHRTTAGFDTGAILSSHMGPMPQDPSPEAVRSVWAKLLLHALDEGVGRALADEPGRAQDETQASYAASFTAEELWLDWTAPATTLQRQATALNLFVPQAKAWIDGNAYGIEELRPVLDESEPSPAGAVLDRSEHTFTIQTGSGAVRVVTTSE